MIIVMIIMMMMTIMACGFYDDDSKTTTKIMLVITTMIKATMTTKMMIRLHDDGDDFLDNDGDDGDDNGVDIVSLFLSLFFWRHTRMQTQPHQHLDICVDTGRQTNIHTYTQRRVYPNRQFDNH